MSSRDIKIKTMRARAVNTLASTIVADAASMATHWVYSAEELATLLGDQLATPEFHETPSCPYYSPTTHTGHYASGSVSPYGEEVLAILNYMTKEKDATLTSGEGLAHAYYKWAKEFTGFKFSTVKLFEANMTKFEAEKVEQVFPKCGMSEGGHQQNNSIWHVPTIVCRYLHNPAECLAKVEEAVRVDQGYDLSVGFALCYTKMLLAAYGGASLKEAVEAGKADTLESIVKNIERAIADTTKTCDGEESDAKMLEYVDALTAEFFQEGMPDYTKKVLAKNCLYPWAFIVSLKIALDAQAMRDAQEKPEEFDVFVWAVRRNIMIGGDTCGRVALFAGLLAATGVALPVDWVKKTTQYDEIEKLAHVLLDAAEAAEPKEEEVKSKEETTAPMEETATVKVDETTKEKCEPAAEPLAEESEEVVAA